MGLRKLLLRVPALRPFVERRWIADPVERAVHDDVVRGRLEPRVPSEASADPPDAEKTRPPS
jgi:hypothetical protein